MFDCRLSYFILFYLPGGWCLLQERKRQIVASAFGENEGGEQKTRLTVEDLRYLFRVWYYWILNSLSYLYISAGFIPATLFTVKESQAAALVETKFLSIEPYLVTLGQFGRPAGLWATRSCLWDSRICCDLFRGRCKSVVTILLTRVAVKAISCQELQILGLCSTRTKNFSLMSNKILF